MPRSLSQRTKLASRKLSPRHVSRQLQTARRVRRFGEQLGLVYFGTVGREQPGYAVIKGFTLSTTRLDRHITIGSFRGYDLALVVRRDSIGTADKRPLDFTWTILKIQLHQRTTLASLVMVDQSMLPVYRSKYLGLQVLPPIDDTTAGRVFVNRFTVFGEMAQRPPVYRFLSDAVMANLVYPLQIYSVELVDDALLVAIPAKYPTLSELRWLVNYGLWLAQLIDGYSAAGN